MRLKNVLNGVRRNWNRPYFYQMRLLEKVVAPLHRRVYDGRGVSVVDEDWDNLLILDACRADVFEEAVASTPLDGEFSTRYSSGSGSVEYLKSNFGGRDCRDTVYVTANPFVKTEIDTPFHAVDHVWVDGWDDELGTVRPETMVRRAKAALGAHPEKRLVVHFMQPHYPFIGETAVESVGLDILRSKAQDEDTRGQGGDDVWARLYNGDVTEDEVWDAYRANLEVALESAVGLVEDIDGRSVITSDHGNAFGERAWPVPMSVYGHPNGIHIDSLRVVPWFECQTDSRREITTGRAGEQSPVDEDIETRLEALGYR